MIKAEFAALFEQLDCDAVLRIRQQLDSNLVFLKSGMVDLRSIVFSVLEEADKARVLKCIRTACKEAGSKGGKVGQRGPFVLLSDVDDTLLPGHDTFKIAGEDRSWKLDGSLYPGVVQLHKELRGDGPDDYTVLFTARPPSMCRKLVVTLHRLAGPEARPRLAILPGSGLMQGAKNVVRMKAAGEISPW